MWSTVSGVPVERVRFHIVVALDRVNLVRGLTT
ncbi:hypothetical protein JS278_01365 [Acidipropionibacterium virtanenii]|uniref:Uncharacterized protein n=1 Tax=Acidipropionibacterium virtanenii TaxID=2057246 RepID=A0A344UTE2_9ACTN|nr:hypothetical protein JS278_01365 [Acidipropionibacterium virtanenii]